MGFSLRYKFYSMFLLLFLVSFLGCVRIKTAFHILGEGFTIEATKPAPLNVKDDMVPPEVYITWPSDGENGLSPTFLLKGTSSDNVAVIKVEVSIDGGPWSKVSGLYSWQFQVISLPGGAHTIQVRAYDPAGNIGTDKISIIVDEELPSVSINSPPDNYAQSSLDLTMNVTAIDCNGDCSNPKGLIAWLETKLDNNDWDRIDVVSQPEVTTNYIFSSLSEGFHTIVVRAKDNDNNYDNSGASIGVCIDASPPTADFLGVQNSIYYVKGSGEYVIPDTTLYLRWHVEDSSCGAIKRVEIYNPNTGVWECVWTSEDSPPSGCPFPQPEAPVVEETTTYSSLANGTYNFSIRAYDKAGNLSALGSITVIVDTLKPSLSYGAPTPSEGSFTNDTSIDVYGTANDNGDAGLREVRSKLCVGYFSSGVCDDYGNFDLTNTTDGFATWSYSYAISSYSGCVDFTIEAFAYDNVFNRSDVIYRHFKRDTESPDLIEIVDPTSYGYKNTGTVTVKANANDACSGINTVYIGYCSGTTCTCTPSDVATYNSSTGYYEYTYTLTNGVYTVCAKAFDGVGYDSGVATSVFTVDTSPPTLSFNRPIKDYNVGLCQDGACGSYSDIDSCRAANILVKVTASDNDGVNRVYIWKKDSGACSSTEATSSDLASDDGGGVYSKSIDFSTYTTGSYLLCAMAVDNAGNVTVQSIPIYIDTTPPSISITPPSRAYCNDQLPQNVTITSNDGCYVTKVCYSTDGSDPDCSSYCAGSGTSASCTLGISNTDSTTNIGYKAVDKVGNYSAASYANYSAYSTYCGGESTNIEVFYQGVRVCDTGDGWLDDTCEYTCNWPVDSDVGDGKEHDGLAFWINEDNKKQDFDTDEYVSSYTAVVTSNDTKLVISGCEDDGVDDHDCICSRGAAFPDYSKMYDQSTWGIILVDNYEYGDGEESNCHPVCDGVNGVGDDDNELADFKYEIRESGDSISYTFPIVYWKFSIPTAGINYYNWELNTNSSSTYVPNPSCSNSNCCGSTSDKYVDLYNCLNSLSSGTYYFHVQAIDNSGYKSAPKVIPIAK